MKPPQALPGVRQGADNKSHWRMGQGGCGLGLDIGGWQAAGMDGSAGRG